MKSSTTEFKQLEVVRDQQFRPIGDVEQEFDNAPDNLQTQKNFSVADSLFVNRSETHLRSGQRVNRRAQSGSYSTTTTDYLIGITSLATAPTIELPRPRLVGIGKVYIVKDEAGGAASTTITVRSGGEENLDGATTSTLTTNYQSRRYYSDGANWFTF